MTIPHKGTTRIRISLPWNPWNFLIYELLDEFLYVFRIPVNRTVRMKTNPSKDWIRRVGLEDPSHHTNWSSSRGPQSSLNAGRSLSPGKISLPYNFSDSILNLKFVKSLFFTHLFLLYLLILQSVQFSCSVMFDSLRPHESQHARPPCPSPPPGVYPHSCPLSWWCHPAISSSVVPFSSCSDAVFYTDEWLRLGKIIYLSICQYHYSRKKVYV